MLQYCAETCHFLMDLAGKAAFFLLLPLAFGLRPGLCRGLFSQLSDSLEETLNLTSNPFYIDFEMGQLRIDAHSHTASVDLIEVKTAFQM